LGISNFISLLAGVSLFLFGMSLMGDGLKRVAGSRLELVLYRLTSSALRSVLLGAGVTAIIQSSSATSVMVVGFVNSGMMRTRQAIGIILGAILGTSITGWILCLSALQGAGDWVSLLSTATLTGIVAVIGIALYLFSKKQVRNNIGGILLGFAVLMFGMQAMTAAVAPLHESEAFLSLLTKFSHPVIGILVGTIFTCILQSASAAVGVLQALAIAGTVNFAVAFPIILGIAIGAAVPVLLSAFGANAEGKRTAVAYLLINAIGALVWGGVFYLADAAVSFPFLQMQMTAVSVAALNTLFRLLTLLLLYPFLGIVERISAAIFRGDEHTERAKADIDRLEERFLAHPALALEQSALAVRSMSRVTRENVLAASMLIRNYNEDLYSAIETTEDLIDRYEDKLGNYLVEIAAQKLTPQQTRELSEDLHAIGDFERIGDHAMNVAQSAREIASKRLTFSGQASRELGVLMAAIEEIVTIAVEAFNNKDIERAYRVEPLEETIDNLCDEMKLHHVNRLQEGTCTLEQGFVFNDLLTDYERIADHCSNIAISLFELGDEAIDAHAYLSTLKEQRTNNFDLYFEEYRKKYSLAQ